LHKQVDKTLLMRQVAQVERTASKGYAWPAACHFMD